MQHARTPSLNQIPAGLRPHFQEYNPSQLDFQRDANLIIQRTLEFGTWDEIRWLFKTYGSKRIRSFLREHGQRGLKPVTFQYWRKLFRIRKWKSSPFPTAKGELWNR
jgi:hypothetical protein